jgi:hypothetical protein
MSTTTCPIPSQLLPLLKWCNDGNTLAFG